MSTEHLGRKIDDGEHWAILTDAGVVDVNIEAERSVNSLAGRIGRDRAGTLEFMQRNKWPLVRIKTTHEIIAVCVEMNPLH
jgi:hypothetical protein